MDTRNEASLAAAALCFADVMALGGLWFATGNLAASLVAAFAINAVDYHNMHKVRDAWLWAQHTLQRFVRCATWQVSFGAECG